MRRKKKKRKKNKNADLQFKPDDEENTKDEGTKDEIEVNLKSSSQ